MEKRAGSSPTTKRFYKAKWRKPIYYSSLLVKVVSGIVPRLIEEGMPYVGKSVGVSRLCSDVVIPEWLRVMDGGMGVDDTRYGVVLFIWGHHNG